MHLVSECTYIELMERILLSQGEFHSAQNALPVRSGEQAWRGAAKMHRQPLYGIAVRGEMLEAISRAVSFRARSKLHKLGVVVSITVIGSRVRALPHAARHRRRRVVDAIRRTEPRQVALAALSWRRAISPDLLLICLRFARSAVPSPHRITALAAFTSYSIGNNVAPASLPAEPCATGSIPRGD